MGVFLLYSYLVWKNGYRKGAASYGDLRITATGTNKDGVQTSDSRRYYANDDRRDFTLYPNPIFMATKSSGFQMKADPFQFVEISLTRIETID